MESTRMAALTILGIMALACGLAAVGPTGWQYGELLLLAALLFVAREFFSVRRFESELRRSKSL